MNISRLYDHLFETDDALRLIDYLKSHGWKETTKGRFDLARLVHQDSTLVVSPIGTIRLSGDTQPARAALDAAKAVQHG